MIKHKNFVSAIVYVNNAEQELAGFLKMLHSNLSSAFENFEIICVNDASRDNSRSVIQELASKFDNCTLSIINMGY